MTVVRPPAPLASPSDDPAAVPQPTATSAEKSRRVFFSAAIGSFIGRIAADGVTDARRQWLPKILEWLE